MCNMSEENLLTYFFGESAPEEEREIKNHVRQCQHCQAFLASLEQTNSALNRWSDEKPMPDTLEMIMENIPHQPQALPQRNDLSLAPVFAIVLSILTIFFALFIFKDQITTLPVLTDLKESWLGQLLGNFGVATISVIALGILASLAFAPILILEARSKKFKYYFN